MNLLSVEGVGKTFQDKAIFDNISFKSKYFKSLNKNLRRSQDRKPFIYENGLIYFVTKKSFLKDKRIYSNNRWSYFITNAYESLDINVNDDYKAAKKLIKL